MNIEGHRTRSESCDPRWHPRNYVRPTLHTGVQHPATQDTPPGHMGRAKAADAPPEPREGESDVGARVEAAFAALHDHLRRGQHAAAVRAADAVLALSPGDGDAAAAKAAALLLLPADTDAGVAAAVQALALLDALDAASADTEMEEADERDGGAADPPDVAAPRPPLPPPPGLRSYALFRLGRYGEALDALPAAPTAWVGVDGVVVDGTRRPQQPQAEPALVALLRPQLLHLAGWEEEAAWAWARAAEARPSRPRVCRVRRAPLAHPLTTDAPFSSHPRTQTRRPGCCCAAPRRWLAAWLRSPRAAGRRRRCRPPLPPPPPAPQRPRVGRTWRTTLRSRGWRWATSRARNGRRLMRGGRTTPRRPRPPRRPAAAASQGRSRRTARAPARRPSPFSA